MLVLDRRIGQEIMIGDGVRVQVVDVQGGKVKLGIVAAKDVSIRRLETPRGPHDEGRLS